MSENQSSYFFVGVPLLLILFFFFSGSVQRTGIGMVKKKYKREAFGQNPAVYCVSIIDHVTGLEIEYEISSTLYFRVAKNEEIRFRYRWGVITGIYVKDDSTKAKLKEAHV